MTIHPGHPFATEPSDRDAARRFRGRLAAPVTLWLTGADDGRAGLTVSSVLVALGEPASVLGLIDPDSSFADALGAAFTVTVLSPADRVLADAFAGLAPAPGGPFRAASFLDTPWGPRPAGERTWLGARVTELRPLGWSVQVIGAVEHVALADETPAVHLRGRYRTLAP